MGRDLPNPTGENNIWLACADGDLATVKSLIASGAATVSSQDENGYSPLHAAASYEHEDIVDYLLSLDPTIVSLTDEDGDTPLHAVESAAMAKRLVDAGASPDVRNLEGMTPLDVAFEDDREEVVEYFKALYTERGIAYTLPEDAGDVSVDGLEHTLADDEADEEASPETSAAMARIERALARTYLEDGQAGDKELRDAVTELVVSRMAAAGAAGAAGEGEEAPTTAEE
ncbi:hypothetical protein H9P43_007133 [Blastocladiella emersonii ATCC 22665]|nr:hypothetical protein H9P43_007133 [Blastocladiella emersonii ATCC 22665]